MEKRDTIDEGRDAERDQEDFSRLFSFASSRLVCFAAALFACVPFAQCRRMFVLSQSSVTGRSLCGDSSSNSPTNTISAHALNSTVGRSHASSSHPPLQTPSLSLL